MPWLQRFIHAPKEDSQRLEKKLLNAGALSVTLKEFIPQGEDEHPILEPALNETPLWNQVQLIALFEANCDTGLIDQRIKADRYTGRWEQLEDKDWEREWMSNYHPIQVANNLWICPSWCEPPEPEAINILLDPGLAFGTGTHPTTFLCMQWLAEQNLQQQSLIDYGCGSGILGLTALKLGASNAGGIDIDPQALIASRENTRRNGIDPGLFPVHLPQNRASLESSDVLVANILAGPLVELKQDILEFLKPGGLLCLSGILVSQAPRVIEHYQDDIDFQPMTCKDEWACVFGKRKSL